MKKPTFTRIYRLLISPFAIAFPFALISILLLPFDFQKYSLNLVSKKIAEKHKTFGRTFYEDLNSDGVSEEIVNFQDFPQMNAIKVTTKNNVLLDQWNFSGEYDFSSSKTFFADYNHDNLSEIFTVYPRNDSLFIGGVHPFNDESFLLKDVFLDTIGKVNNNVDFICDLTSHDLDKDGFNEILITINAGFSKYPRRIYAWNIYKNSILKSPATGFKIGSLDFLDINDDGFEEIFVSTTSQNNIKASDNIPYIDDFLWLSAYDHELNFLFEPKKIAAGSGSISPIITKNEDLSKKILLECFNRNSAQKFSYFYFNPLLKTLDTVKPNIDVPDFHGLKSFKYNQKDGFLFADSENGVFWVDENFDNKTTLFTTAGYWIYNFDMDIDGDSMNEILLYKKTGEFSILSDDFKCNTNFEIPILQKLQQISIRYLSPDKKHLVIQTDQVINEFNYLPNPIYPVKWALYGLIYLLYVLAIWLFLHFQNKYIENKYKMAKNLAELRLKSIRNQMDPHFTFNAINAIGAAIYKEDKQVAYNYFSKFSQLIRLSMLYSDRMSRSLSDEIDFTIRYLEIEKFRYKEKFNYQINVDDEVEQFQQVPRMVLQTFAESAINNGLMHRTENGLLDIDIRYDGDLLVLTITDNGGGIEKSKLLNKEKAFKSVTLIDEFFSILNSFNKTEVTYEMKDLYEGSQITGTQAIVKIPYNLKFTF